ncbi:MAG: DUF6265 family protein [Cyclobacteriaceae bacterium]
MRLLTLLFVLSSCRLAAQETKEFDWLVGKWERENIKPGRTAFEIWERNNETLNGIGVTLQGADTVFVEKLSILNKYGQLYYVANVSSNASPTLFKITSYDESGFVSENPAHDFPKKIAYSLSGNTMLATISGNGKEIPFSFKKVE